MKVLAFAASNSRQSINQALVKYSGEVLKDLDSSVEVEVLDLNDYEMPIYSIDRENAAGIPLEAQRFFNRVREADALVISFAEHNGSYTVAYKNLFDWASRIDMKVYQGKPVVLLSASPGPGGGQNVLRTAEGSMPFFGATVVGSLSVGPFGEKFDAEAKRLVDGDIDAELRGALNKLTLEKAAAA